MPLDPDNPADIHFIRGNAWIITLLIREMTKGGFGFNEIWINLPDWIRDLDVDSIRREAGIENVTEQDDARERPAASVFEFQSITAAP
jgi:hypothetical protein